MTWNPFFNPTFSKIIIFLLSMGALNYIVISSNYFIVTDARILVGLPLGFWPTGSWSLDVNPTPPVIDFSWVNFLIDVAFWYLVSCGVVSLYHKSRKR